MKTYTIDYCNGVKVDVECADIADAQEIADERASYTQCDIVVSGKGEEVRRQWWGVKFDAEVDESEDPILFGDSGYYSDWG